MYLLLSNDRMKPKTRDWFHGNTFVYKTTNKNKVLCIKIQPDKIYVMGVQYWNNTVLPRNFIWANNDFSNTGPGVGEH